MLSESTCLALYMHVESVVDDAGMMVDVRDSAESASFSVILSLSTLTRRFSDIRKVSWLISYHNLKRSFIEKAV